MSEASETKMALVEQKLDYVKEKVDKIDENVSTHYVSREEFEPIKKLTYGLVGLILASVVGALISLVLKG